MSAPATPEPLRWIDRLDRPGLRALEAALRAHQPLGLRRCPLPLPPALLLPLLRAAEDPTLRRWLPPAPPPISPPPQISVVLPMLQRPLGLQGWLDQIGVEVELILIANGGYDGADLRDPRCRTLRTPWLGHGPTRQLGVLAARHPLVLLTVDDALPGSPHLLLRLAHTLATSPRAEVVTARQIPWPTADPVTRQRLLAWTPPGDTPTPAARIDHVAALYRRDSLLLRPIPPAPIAEDWHRQQQTPPEARWYDPGAPVLHSHPRRFRPLLARTIATHREFRAAGLPPAIPDLPSLLRALPSTLTADLPGALAELLGQSPIFR